MSSHALSQYGIIITMKQTAKALVTVIVFTVLLLGGLLFINRGSETQATLNIVAVNFPGYDFARAVVRDVPGISLQMLVSPGAEVHDFEPTPEDIKAVKSSSLFIYTGGESDAWVENLIKDLDDTKIVKMTNIVATVEEETVEGMENSDEAEAEDEVEIDEHVWTSLRNAAKIINQIKNDLVELDPRHQTQYEQNAKSYTDQLASLDQKIQSVVKNTTRNTIVFGDRFPFRYFVEDYDLKYYAAFPGCSEQTEPSAKTLAFLIDQVKSEKIPVVFYLELSNRKVAETIATATGAKTLELHSAHNISEDDFEGGRTYLDIMTKNLETLEEALR